MAKTSAVSNGKKQPEAATVTPQSPSGSPPTPTAPAQTAAPLVHAPPLAAPPPQTPAPPRGEEELARIFRTVRGGVRIEINGDCKFGTDRDGAFAARCAGSAKAAKALADGDASEKEGA